MARVSVVMPAYNVALFIESAIRSVIAQTYSDFELIIVDDGSTDETQHVCRQFDDARIRLVVQKNRGLAGARNAGIRESVGEFIAFLDSDDAWREDKLARHVNHLECNPAVGVSYSASQFMSHDGELLDLYQTPKLADVEASDVFCRNPVGNGSSPVIRRATLRDIQFIDDRFGVPEPMCFDPDFRQSEDIECWVRIATTTQWAFAGIGEPLTHYRLNAGGLSASVNKQLASWEAFVTKASDYAPALVARKASLARAYQYRYLARRSLWSGESRLAASMLTNALRSEKWILIREPARTLATCAAVILQNLMPISWYRRIERFALSLSKSLAV